MNNSDRPAQTDVAHESAAPNADGGLDRAAKADAKFRNVLGRVLRSVREGRGFSWSGSAPAMGTGATASHEFGTRASTVARFTLYCNVRGLSPSRMVDRAYGEKTADGTAVLGLAELARSGYLLACWAESRLGEPLLCSMRRLPVPLTAQGSLAEMFEHDRGQVLAGLKAA
ncbi:hypothetical protein [Amycolatopsis sp. NPDC004079]|uniref:hypothetical protein n=1 Tax=Amycolatopsis sp. NPDC004079 TaxID=3154549 RepID=UPI0033BC42A9